MFKKIEEKLLPTVETVEDELQLRSIALKNTEKMLSGLVNLTDIAPANTAYLAHVIHIFNKLEKDMKTLPDSKNDKDNTESTGVRRGR